MRDGTITQASRRLLVPVMLCALAVGGCASASGGSSGGSRNIITQAEIAESNVGTAYEAVRLLRPGFLQSRGMGTTSGGSNEPVLYVDGVYRGELRGLQQIDASVVQEIRYLDGPDATTRFGTGHSAGAILVTTRTG